MSAVRECPMCGGLLNQKVYENRGVSGRGLEWFAGLYQCGVCKNIYAASGSIVRMTSGKEVSRLRSWAPACPEHGPHRVIRTYTDKYTCLSCQRAGYLRNFEVRNGKLVTTRQRIGRVLAVA